jgi:drug/metabolite transporter (DMT)-like permease
VSDVFIVHLISAIHPSGGFRASMFALVLSYLFAGLVSICAWKYWQHSKREEWLQATGFAFCWFGHMLCLYGAIPLIGLVHSVILQSSRSVFAVCIGIFVSTYINQSNETKIRKSMRNRQWASAFAVVLATFIFQYVN